MNTICTRASKVLLSPEGQELVLAYNEATSQLVSYEITVYQTWTKLVSSRLFGCVVSIIRYSLINRGKHNFSYAADFIHSIMMLPNS